MNHPISLRFVRTDIEIGFRRVQLGRILGVVSTVALVLAVAGGLESLFLYVTRDHDDCMNIGTVLAVFCLILGVCMKIFLLRHRQPFREASHMVLLSTEVSAVVLIFGIFIACVMEDGCYSGEFAGREANFQDDEESHSESQVVLRSGIFLLVSHLHVPVRWCVLWPTEVGCIGTFIWSAKFWGSSGRSRSVNEIIVLKCVLTVLVDLAKRKVESLEREAYWSVSLERTLRATLEAQPNVSRFKMVDTVAHEDSGAASTIVGSSADFDSDPHGLVEAKLARISYLGTLEHWLLRVEDVRLLPHTILGAGSYGMVIAGRLHGTPVAVKVPINSTGVSDIATLPELVHELRVYRHMRHPNIVLFHGACVDPVSSELALVLEFLDGIALEAYIKSKTEAPSVISRQAVLIGICRALRYMHERQPVVVHGDLKPTNIMIVGLTGAPCAKLLDLGLSRLLTTTVKPLGGSLAWMAPESLKKKRVMPTTAADVYSYGCLTFFIVMRTAPFTRLTRNVLLAAAHEMSRLPLDWTFRGSDPMGDEFAQIGQQIAHPCLDPVPLFRPSMHTVMEQLQENPFPDDDEDGCSDSEEIKHCEMSWEEGMAFMRENVRDVQKSRMKFTMNFPGGPPGGAGCFTKKDPVTSLESARVPEPRVEQPVEPDPLVEQGPQQEVRLFFPEAFETPLRTRLMMISNLALMWNCAVEDDSCCLFHTAMNLMPDLLRVVAQGPCLDKIGDEEQCVNCGVMNVADINECQFCCVQLGVGKGSQRQSATPL